MAKIAIKNMRTKKIFGKVKAFFTLNMGPVEIEDLRLIEGSNGLFVGFPSKKVKTQDGSEKYIDLVRFTRDSAGKLTDSAKKLSDEILEAAQTEYARRSGEELVPAADSEDDDLPF